MALKEKYKMAYDSEGGGSFKVHTNKGEDHFKYHSSGLYYLNTKDMIGTYESHPQDCCIHIFSHHFDDVVMMTDTVRCKFEGFAKAEVE